VEQRVEQGLRVCDWAYVMAADVQQLSGPAAEILGSEDIGALFLGQRLAIPERSSGSADSLGPGTPVQ
jgi:hypothetical protein